MAKPKKTEEVQAPKVVETTVEMPKPVNPTILPITENFSMGDLNQLRDKINEIIKRIA